MTAGWPVDAAKTRDPSGLIASSVGGVVGIVASNVDAGSWFALAPGCRRRRIRRGSEQHGEQACVGHAGRARSASRYWGW
jgi:hypothetical protein